MEEAHLGRSLNSQRGGVGGFKEKEPVGKESHGRGKGNRGQDYTQRGGGWAGKRKATLYDVLPSENLPLEKKFPSEGGNKECFRQRLNRKGRPLGKGARHIRREMTKLGGGRGGEGKDHYSEKGERIKRMREGIKGPSIRTPPERTL